MDLRKLSLDEQQTILNCMKFIAKNQFIEDWEFETRLGLSRASLARIISTWPEINTESENSDVFFAINGSLNEVCHGIDIPEVQWRDHFYKTKEEVRKILAKWQSQGNIS